MKYLSYFILPTKELEDDYLWELGNTCQYLSVSGSVTKTA